MTVSSLAEGCSWSPNHYDGRAYPITRLTPHHTAMIGTAAQIAAVFKPPSREASCNYAIGVDGSIVCVVAEEDASWCTASWDNDNRGITFELSDCDYDWNISQATLESYIELCVDLIQRYPSLGGSYRWTGDLDGNVTIHRWFAATTCCGDPLYELQDYIMQEVNRRLHGEEPKEDEVKQEDIDAIVAAVAAIGEPFNDKAMYYKAHVANIGWQSQVRDGQVAGTTGRGLGIEAIEFAPPSNIGLKISAHIAYDGWVDYDLPSGGIVGTTGQSKSIEALKIDAKVPVKYRVHVQNIGWQDWVSNGRLAGTTGEGLQIEAFQMMLA